MDPELLIPLSAILLIFGMPIIAILLHHQRKMAELLRGGTHHKEEFSQLSIQVHQLSQLVHQNTIGIDDLRSRLPLPAAAPSEVQHRLQE